MSKPKQFAVLTIGEVVKRSGVAASALRFYEEKGLIHSLREQGDTGHRRYHRGVLRRIAFIVFAQRVGLSLEQIAVELAKAPRDRAPSKQDWEKISKTWDRAIDDRIAELERLKRGLGDCIGCGCLSLETCQLVNPRDRAGANGPGARYWIGDPRPRKR
jgi:MerR family transcriptional regulator, redox-sensitive transcriptional activator SoxR